VTKPHLADAHDLADDTGAEQTGSGGGEVRLIRALWALQRLTFARWGTERRLATVKSS